MGIKIVCQNKKAYHDYHIDAKFEAGMVLSGPEVKSLRAGKANLKDGYVQIDERGELRMYNVHISQYVYATHNPNDPMRAVITSYSIHYTKLYEAVWTTSPCCAMAWCRCPNIPPSN